MASQTRRKRSVDPAHLAYQLGRHWRRISARIPASRPGWIVVRLAGSFPTAPPAQPPLLRALPRFVPIELDQDLSLLELDGLLRAAAETPWLKGVVFRIEDLSASASSAYGIRRCIEALRQAGKQTRSFVQQATFTSLYVAAATDHIVVPPSVDTSLYGFSLRLTYWRQALDKIGIRVQRVAMGDYKDGFENFAADQMSDRTREQLERYLHAASTEILTGIATGRNKSVDAVRADIDAGLVTSKELRQAGWVDEIAYEQDVVESAQAAPADEAWSSLVPFAKDRGRIALIPIEGALISGKSRRSPMPLPGVSRVAGAETVVQALRQAHEDPRTVALVLVVNSPGGSANASERIAQEVRRIRIDKPVVAAMGDYAASGGYMVSALAHRIICAPMTVTGSIGAFAAKFSTRGTVERIGAKTESVSFGRFANLTAPSADWNADDEALIGRSLEHTYDSFVGVVEEGRKLSREKLEPLCGGRMWSGRDAVDSGLADQVGDIRDAIAEAGRLANTGPRAHVYVAHGKGSYLLPTAADPLGWQRIWAPLNAQSLCLLPYQIASL